MERADEFFPFDGRILPFRVGRLYRKIIGGRISPQVHTLRHRTCFRLDLILFPHLPADIFRQYRLLLRSVPQTHTPHELHRRDTKLLSRSWESYRRNRREKFPAPLQGFPHPSKSADVELIEEHLHGDGISGCTSVPPRKKCHPNNHRRPGTHS
mgnify:CR=1 FL=1